jgi:hypothetical protein
VSGQDGSAGARLYALPPSQFVAARTALVREAKAAGDPSAALIAVLRRPSTAAWAVNHLVRCRPDLAERLDDLGGRLRSAQTRRDASSLKLLRTHRDALLAELVAAARAEADAVGVQLSPAASTALRDTAVAALADARAAAAVLSGQLTRALTYSGFGEVDLADAVARTATGVAMGLIRGHRDDDAPTARPDDAPTARPADVPRAPPADAADDRPAGRDADTAEAARQAARHRLAQADAAVREARRHAAATERRLAALRVEVAEATDDAQAAHTALQDAVRAQDAARRALEAATGEPDTPGRG